MKKWLGRLAAGAGILLLGPVLLVLAASPFVRRIAVQRAERDFPPPGRLVEIDGRRSHIHCTGTGSPTILLESGLDTRGSMSWAGIRDELSRVSRVCAYDRAGVMWSEARGGPRDAERIAGELHALLAGAEESPPYVLVGHSLGGALVRVYDARYPGEAAGFVLVDSSHPEQESRFPAEVRALFGGGPALPGWVVGALTPYGALAGRPRAPHDAYLWRSVADGVMRESAAADAIFAQAARTGPLGDRPLVVLTAGLAPPLPRVSEAGNAEMRRVTGELQRELARLSTASDHRIVEGAGHYVHWDRPEAVVAAIRDVVAAVREGRPVARRAAGSP